MRYIIRNTDVIRLAVLRINRNSTVGTWCKWLTKPYICFIRKHWCNSTSAVLRINSNSTVWNQPSTVWWVVHIMMDPPLYGWLGVHFMVFLQENMCGHIQHTIGVIRLSVKGTFPQPIYITYMGQNFFSKYSNFFN